MEVLDPAVVVTVGKHSLQRFRPGDRISQVHGTTRPIDPSTGVRNGLAFAMYHPAFALYQGSNRPTLFADIAGLPGAVAGSRERRLQTPAQTPVQAAPAVPPAEPTITVPETADTDQLTLF